MYQMSHQFCINFQFPTWKLHPTEMVYVPLIILDFLFFFGAKQKLNFGLWKKLKFII
jgi:hypothetical protein